MLGERLFARFFDAVGASPILRRHVLTELSAPSRHWHGTISPEVDSARVAAPARNFVWERAQLAAGALD